MKNNPMSIQAKNVWKFALRVTNGCGTTILTKKGADAWIFQIRDSL